MKLSLGKTSLRINISFAAVITLMLILDSSGTCAVALFCCIVHEAGHIICMLILGENPAAIELSFYGIKLERKEPTALTAAEEIAVCAAGPFMNLVFSAFMMPFASEYAETKTAAAISLCIGIFNLIPCVPLDGGNILSSFLFCMTSEEKAKKLCIYTACASLISMAVTGIVIFLKSGNFTLIAVTLYLLWLNRKIIR